jgi:capsular exopolysaccharide synthesis family protein
MSKIFDALNKEQADFPDILPPIGEAPRAEVPPAAAQLAAARTAPEPFPPAVRKKPVAVAPPAKAPDAASAPDETGGFRLVSLRVPLSVPLLPFDGVSTSASEEYRLIRARIRQHPSKPRMILVSSAGPGDGKTVTAINIAGALALKGGTRVLVVDADFSRSSVHVVAGIPQSPGLVDILAGNATLEDAIAQVEQLPNLHMLPAGEAIMNPAELLDSPNWVALCETLRRRFDYVILDSPPVEATPYYGHLQSAADAVALVVRPDHTRRTQLAQALGTMPPQKMLGFILNCTSPWFLNQDYRYIYGDYSRVAPPG